MKGNKYAISSAAEAPTTAPILLKGEITDNLKKAATLGYNAIEIHLRETERLDYLALEKAMAETGVRISAVVTGRLATEGGVNLMDDRPYITSAAMAGMRQYVNMAQSLQSNIIVGWVRGNLPVGKSESYYYNPQ